MDDAAQVQAKNNTQQVSAPPPPPQHTTHAPVSLPHKEHAPSGQSADYAGVRVSVPEPELHPEVSGAGVTAAPPHPVVHADAAVVGLVPAKDTVPVNTTPSSSIQLPMTRTQARQAKEKYSIKFSIRWMAELVLEQFKRARQKKAV